MKRYRIMQVAEDQFVVERRIFFVWCDIDPPYTGYRPRMNYEQAKRKFEKLVGDINPYPWFICESDKEGRVKW